MGITSLNTKKGFLAGDAVEEESFRQLFPGFGAINRQLAKVDRLMALLLFLDVTNQRTTRAVPGQIPALIISHKYNVL
jgi:hypothetical protein